MARPQRCRRVCSEPAYDTFAPGGISSGETIVLTVDEYEVIRLVDFEKKTHEQCAALMEISRTTVTEIYQNARYKIADSLVNGKGISISGGNYRLCDGTADCRKKKLCRRIPGTGRINVLYQKGENTMRIAVTYENGEIFQHFGHTQKFKIYDVEDKKIVKEQVIDTMGSGHGALAGFLLENGVNALICGGIGGGAQNALAEAGIQLYGGVAGSADDAARALAEGVLAYNPNVHCSHHGHGEGHSCGEHHCGEDKHGCAGH